MTKPNRLAAVAQRDEHTRPTIPAPADPRALNACRAHAIGAGLPSQLERRKRKAQARLFERAQSTADTIPAPPCANDAEPELDWSDA